MLNEFNKDEALPKELFNYISGRGEGHWQTERVQPAIIKFVEQGIFHCEVVDIGCGIADNIIYIGSDANNVNIRPIHLVIVAIILFI